MAAKAITGIDHSVLNFLFLAVALITAPHAFHLPAPLFGFFTLVLVWRWLALVFKSLQPSRLMRSVLLLLGLGLLFTENHGIAGRDAGTGILIVALALKLFEIRQLRDVYLIIFLAFFVVITQFLFSQSMGLAVYLLASTILLLATLVSAAGRGPAPGLPLRTAITLVVQALPLMAILFIFFPRINLPQFHWRLAATNGISGLSETLQPGQIGRLAMSRQTAFRVSFNGPLPEPSLRYWRGPVFWHTDGQRWSRGDHPSMAPEPVEFTGLPITYTLTLEPHGQRWLFALDLPAEYPGSVHQTDDYQLLAEKPIDERRVYTLTSYPQYRTSELSPWERQRGLQLPGQPTTRIRALVAGWLTGSASNQVVIGQALRYFYDQPFVYTLNPPRLDKDPVDQFLFETRKGFCGHYATAFVYLMRVAGIPARVVTGYMGGIYNHIGGFLEVQQSNAHAWAEVWLEEKGWVRVDPTASINPARVESESIDSWLNGSTTATTEMTVEKGAWGKLTRQLEFAFSALDYGWKTWVLNYTPERQLSLLSRLGIRSQQGMVLWLGIGCGLLLISIAGLLLRGKVGKADPVLAVYQRFCRRLEGAGQHKAPVEGPRDFALRAAAALPERAGQIIEITDLYLRLRYGSRSDSGELRQLRTLVRRFRPG